MKIHAQVLTNYVTGNLIFISIIFFNILLSFTLILLVLLIVLYVLLFYLLSRFFRDFITSYNRTNLFVNTFSETYFDLLQTANYR